MTIGVTHKAPTQFHCDTKAEKSVGNEYFSKISDFQISPKYEIEPKYFAEMRNETKLKSSLNKDKYFCLEWKKSNI